MSAPGLGVGPLQGVAGVAVAVPGVPGRAVHTAHHGEAGEYLQLELLQDMGEFCSRRVIMRDGHKRRLIIAKDG